MGPVVAVMVKPLGQQLRMLGLLLLVGRRRRLLGYLADIDIERYRSLIERLGLRR